MLIKNNCQCELCRSVWGELENKGQTPLTRIEAVTLASFAAPYPSVLTLNPAKVEIEELYENN